MNYSLRDLMELVVTERGEAVHLHEGEAPVLEVKRTLHRIEGPAIPTGGTEELLKNVATAEDISELRAYGLSCSYFHFNDVVVFQVMAFRENGQVRLELRKFK